MNVTVDPTGQRDQAGGIYDVLRRTKLMSQRDDPPAADTYIAVDDLRACDNATASDDQIVAHGVPPVSFIAMASGAVIPMDVFGAGLFARGCAGRVVAPISTRVIA